MFVMLLLGMCVVVVVVDIYGSYVHVFVLRAVLM